MTANGTARKPTTIATDSTRASALRALLAAFGALPEGAQRAADPVPQVEPERQDGQRVEQGHVPAARGEVLDDPRVRAGVVVGRVQVAGRQVQDVVDHEQQR